MWNTPKPDDRRDNVDRIQENIDNTIENRREAEEMIRATDNPQMKKDLSEKNHRREEAVEGMREEIKEEAAWAKENGYK
jgi:small acid-soluble spore protein (thioredoxin-like protein)